jgi:hypothetical protein
VPLSFSKEQRIVFRSETRRRSNNLSARKQKVLKIFLSYIEYISIFFAYLQNKRIESSDKTISSNESDMKLFLFMMDLASSAES